MSDFRQNLGIIFLDIVLWSKDEVSNIIHSEIMAIWVFSGLIGII